MQHQAIYRKDYIVPSFFIKKTTLTIQVFDEYTRVISLLEIEKNLNGKDNHFFLHGEDLELEYATINAEPISENQHKVTDKGMDLYNLPTHFTFSSTCKIYPHKNTSCEGLYQSQSMLSTQCEAEGFRKITYFADRPDIMSEFLVRLESSKTKHPVLLSNGNLQEQGELENNRHFALWHDPFVKPSYLFAVVMGDLTCLEDSFTTKSNRLVKLAIYTESQWIDECRHAMESLKKAMKWDELTYNREYDLNSFSIVAVRDFNMGAMENKSLNIFNASCILGTSKTATDAQLNRIEGIIAHEYFHNWTGNRITCRDWFQLTLKEGLTVYRDQEFSADQTSKIEQRIDDVSRLRSFQFPEDASKLAHPIRPEKYVEINNFYTVTVYEKGAEVIRMIASFLDKENFQKGMQYYFQTYDNQAVTCDDFIYALEQGSDQDLSLFKHWYEQAGTPVLKIETNYNQETKEYTLTFKQSCPATPEKEHKEPFPIPVRLSLLSQQGAILDFSINKTKQKETTLLITKQEETITLHKIASKPILSALRNFSAPIILDFEQTIEEKLKLIQYDSDLFNRYEASQFILKKIILSTLEQQPVDTLFTQFIDTIRTIWNDPKLEPSFLAQLITLPSLSELETMLESSNPISLHQTHEKIKTHLGNRLEDLFLNYYKKTTIELKQYKFSPQSNGQRKLKNICLSYLVQQQKQEYITLAKNSFSQASNMTDQQACLSMLVCYAPQEAPYVLEAFAKQWNTHPVVMETYFAIQAASPCFTVDKIKKLTTSPYFEANNPNKIRSVFGVFSSINLMNFHNETGSGYRLLADKILEQNKNNPQIAARLSRIFVKWSQYTPQFQSKMKEVIEKIQKAPNLSADVEEIINKSLQG